MAEDRPNFDFTVEKPGRGIRLLVEAKNTRAASPEWAAEFLHNLLEYVDAPPAEYLLLALRDHLYLWRGPIKTSGAPDFEGNTAAALRPYLERLTYTLDTLSQSSFQLLIHAWLSDLVAGASPDDDNRKWLEESGLVESIRDASIRTNIAA